jgi:hypothetical protein
MAHAHRQETIEPKCKWITHTAASACRSSIPQQQVLAYALLLLLLLLLPGDPPRPQAGERSA